MTRNKQYSSESSSVLGMSWLTRMNTEGSNISGVHCSSEATNNECSGISQFVGWDNEMG